MKILLITSKYLPHVGGLENAVYHLAKEFKKNHEVRIITNRYPRQLPKKEIIDHIRIERIFFVSLFFKGNTCFQFIKYLVGILIIPFSIISLYKKINSFKPDVINYHFVNYSALYVLLATKFYPKCRLVLSLHGEDVESFPHESKYNWYLFKKILQRAHSVTTCSNYLLNETKKIIPDIGSKSIATGNGIDLNDFELKEVYRHPKPYIFSMGRLVKKKGMEFLIKAFNNIVEVNQEVHLLIAGDGPEKDNLELLIDQLDLGERVKLLGIVEGDEKIELLRGCKFFVLPSIREPFGIVLLEAMAAGKAIVTTNVGGIPEIIQNGVNGILVKKEDVDSLTNGIMSLSNEEKLVEKLSLNGEKIVRNRYTWKKISEKYLATYKGSLKL